MSCFESKTAKTFQVYCTLNVLQTFYKFCHWRIGAKEKFQTASGFAIDFVLNFAMPLFDFSCF